jgi:hypothetical protein
VADGADQGLYDEANFFHALSDRVPACALSDLAELFTLDGSEDGAFFPPEEQGGVVCGCFRSAPSLIRPRRWVED